MNKRRKPVRPTVLRAIVYIRVSTQQQAASGAGLEHQRQACAAHVLAHGWELVEVIADEGESGTKAPDDRPGLGRALAMLESGEADVLVALKIDRVSRSVLDFSDMVKRADMNGWRLETLDVPIDPSTPIGKATRNMLATFAQLERDFIAQRTSEALAIKIEQGVKVGRSNSADPNVIADIRTMRESGMSWPKIAGHLNETGVPTSQGGAKWHPMTCKRLAESER